MHGKLEIEGITARQLFQVLINPHNMSLFDETFIRAKILDTFDCGSDLPLSVSWHAMKVTQGEPQPGIQGSVLSELETFFTSRDFLYVQTLKKLSRSRFMILQKSVESEEHVVCTSNAPYERGTVWVSAFILRPGSAHGPRGSCIVEHLYGADLKGVLAEVVCADIVYRRLEGLQKFALRFKDDEARLAALNEVNTYNLDHQYDASGLNECKQLDDDYLEWSKTLRIP